MELLRELGTRKGMPPTNPPRRILLLLQWLQIGSMAVSSSLISSGLFF